MTERETLPQAIQETARGLAEQLNKLTEGVVKGLHNQNGQGVVPTGLEIAAALHTIGVLAIPLGEVVGEHYDIFPDNGQSEEETREGDKRPTTFSELLRSEINRKLLPSKTTIFDGKALHDIMTENKMYGLGTFLRLNPPPANLTREEAVKFIEGCLEATYKTVQKDLPLTKKDIVRTWAIPIILIDQWAKEIGCNWDDGSPISPEEVNAIRGLNRLDKILKKRPET